MTADEGFADIDWDESLQAEDYLSRMPADAYVRGMFFTDVCALWPVDDRPGPYRAFRKYPAREYGALLHRAASERFDGLNIRNALAKLGEREMDVFLGSTVGRVFLALTRDPASMMRKAMQGLEVVQNYGHIELVSSSDRSVVVRCRDLYDFGDCHYVGLLMRAVGVWGVTPNARIRRHDVMDFDLELSW